MTQTATPVLQNERADILDLLRDFALLVLCHYLSWPYWFLFLVGLRGRPSNQKI